MKMKILMPNCQGLSVGVPKFSAVIKSNAAAAMSPTTVGRNNSNIDTTTGWSWKR